jgi:hypothetical protein
VKIRFENPFLSHKLTKFDRNYTMFSTVRYFIKTSIVFLILGILTGMYMMILKNHFNTWPDQELISAHTHVILFGTVMMMIMGVALWFFPRPEKEDKLYNPVRILITYYLMTISTSVRFICQVIASQITPGTLLLYLITISSAFQILGMIIFFISMWGRIRSVGSHIREAKGEKF